MPVPAPWERRLVPGPECGGSPPFTDLTVTTGGGGGGQGRWPGGVGTALLSTHCREDTEAHTAHGGPPLCHFSVQLFKNEPDVPFPKASLSTPWSGGTF